MRTLATEDGDLVLRPRQEGLADGLASLRQRVVQRMRFLLGEWFRDARLGTPYRPSVLGRAFSESTTLQALNAAVLSVDGVTGISESSVQVDGQRVMVYRVRIQNSFGADIDLAEEGL